MKVKCITNRFSDIDTHIYDGIYGFSSATELPIEIGQESIVYGITIIRKHLWYLVDVERLQYPMYYPAEIFKILDGRLSNLWIISEGIDSYDNNSANYSIGFKEIVENVFFYGEYLEDYPAAIEIFNRYRILLRKEFDS